MDPPTAIGGRSDLQQKLKMLHDGIERQATLGGEGAQRQRKGERRKPRPEEQKFSFRKRARLTPQEQLPPQPSKDEEPEMNPSAAEEDASSPSDRTPPQETSAPSSIENVEEVKVKEYPIHFIPIPRRYYSAPHQHIQGTLSSLEAEHPAPLFLTPPELSIDSAGWLSVLQEVESEFETSKESDESEGASWMQLMSLHRDVPGQLFAAWFLSPSPHPFITDPDGS